MTAEGGKVDPSMEGGQQGPAPPYQQPQYGGGYVPPAPVTTTTIITNPGGGRAPQNVRDWNTGLCGCFEDIGSCCFALFCWDYFLCGLAGQLGEYPCGPCCCGCPFQIAMRVKARTMMGISFCAMTQLKRELDKMNMGNNQTQVIQTQVHPH